MPTPEPGHVAEAPTTRNWERFLDGAAAIAVGTEVWRQANTQASFLGLALLVICLGAVLMRRRYTLASVAVATVASGLVGLAPSSAFPVWLLTQVCAFAVPLRCRRGVSVAVAIALS